MAAAPPSLGTRSPEYTYREVASARVASPIVIPLYQCLTGHHPWAELRRLRGLQWRSPEELETSALGKLGPLLAQATEVIQ